MTLTFRHVVVEYKHIQIKVKENMMFYSFDLDLDSITLILKLDLDMVKMYQHTKNERQPDKHIARQTLVKLLPTRICGW